MQPFFVGLAQRAGWTAFAAALGRWIGPQIGQYMVAQTVRPYILPLAGIGLGAAISGQVLQRLTNGYQGVVRWLNQTASVAGTMTVVLGVVYWVAWNNQGPVNRIITGVTAILTTPGTITTEEARRLLLVDFG